MCHVTSLTCVKGVMKNCIKSKDISSNSKTPHFFITCNHCRIMKCRYQYLWKFLTSIFFSYFLSMLNILSLHFQNSYFLPVNKKINRGEKMFNKQFFICVCTFMSFSCSILFYCEPKGINIFNKFYLIKFEKFV